MASKPDYYVIGHDAGHELPYSFAWFEEIGSHWAADPWKYFATKAEAHEFATKVRGRNPVCLDEDE